MMTFPFRSPSTARPRLVAALLLLVLAAAAAARPADAAVNSARYRFEGNRWLSLDLAVAEVRTDVVRFEWPSTMLGIKTRYKAVIKVVNGSTHQVSAGVAVAVYDADGKLLGAGTTGTKVGTIDPGDAAEFTVDFDHVSERLEAAAQFQVALQTR